MVDESMLTLFHSKEIIESAKEGATAGAESGAVFGPVGAGVGAGWGAALGYLGGVTASTTDAETMDVIDAMDPFDLYGATTQMDPMAMLNPLLAGQGETDDD
ncbi:hypothetical protein [Halosegnis sp.]|uniref:hypothetical protein n=1 Tax=Halosegnis sp. TaxID=2864959 RepID=UPI0035D3F866